MKLTDDQIDAVVEWMNERENLRNTAIPLRFKEDFSKESNNKIVPKFVKCSRSEIIAVNQSGSSIGGGVWEYLFEHEVAALGIDPKNTANAGMTEPSLYRRQLRLRSNP